MRLLSLIVLTLGLYAANSAVIPPKCDITNRTQLLDMSNDCQMLILESLNFEELVQMAQTNEHFSYLASYVFNRLHVNMKFIISTGRFYPEESMTVGPNFVYMNTIDVVETIFRSFGHLIQKLSFHFDNISSVDRKKIVDLITKYCTNSVIKMEMSGFDEKVLPAFKQPLPNVETLSLSGELKSSQAMSLSDLFPGLRNFHISQIDIFDASVLDVHFPKLEHFEINPMFFYTIQSPEDRMKNTRQAVELFLRNNPHLKSLEISECYSLEYLQMASDFLPQLEELRVKFVALEPYNGKPIHLMNVKKLKLGWVDFFDLSNIVLVDGVEELELTGEARNCIELAKRYKNVKVLKYYGGSLSEHHILEISRNLQQLEEIVLMSDSNIQPESVVQLIQSNDNLVKVTVIFDATMREVLMHEFDGKWNIQSNRFEIILHRIL